MKPRIVILTLSVLFFLPFQGCNKQEGVYELFSGSIPRIEIAESEGSRYTEALTLFLTLKGNAVEVAGEVYPLETTSEDLPFPT